VRSWSASAFSSWSFTHKFRKASSVATLASASMTIKVGNAKPLAVLRRMVGLW
jgi:hypothetical protein